MIKLLYFDTNSIVKYFVNEKGSDLVKWIVDNRVLHHTHILTSQIANYEFKIAIKKKEENETISNEELKKILSISKPYFSTVFRSIDSHRIPKFKTGKDTNYVEICAKHGRKIEKDSRDGRHLSCVINFLRCYSEGSKPRIVTSDKNFIKIIKLEGYEVINPEQTTKELFLSIISN